MLVVFILNLPTQVSLCGSDHTAGRDLSETLMRAYSTLSLVALLACSTSCTHRVNNKNSNCASDTQVFHCTQASIQQHQEGLVEVLLNGIKPARRRYHGTTTASPVHHSYKRPGFNLQNLTLTRFVVGFLCNVVCVCVAFMQRSSAQARSKTIKRPGMTWSVLHLDIIIVLPVPEVCAGV